MRPAGRQLDPAISPHRGDAQLLGALQLEVKGKLQGLSALAIQRGQRRMHTGTKALLGAAGSKTQVHAIETQLQVIADATDIADAHREEGLAKLVQTQLIAQAQTRRQLEGTADLVVAAVQQRLVDAPRPLLGGHRAIEHKALRQEVQTPAAPLLLHIALTGFVMGFPLMPDLGVRHHQNRPGKLLAIAGTARDILQHLGALVLPLPHQAADHRQWNQQQQNQQGDSAQLETQNAVHGATLRYGLGKRSLGGSRECFMVGLWRLCGESETQP